MISFHEFLGILNENGSAQGWDFNANAPSYTYKIGSTTILLIPINYPGHGERSSDFGMIVKNSHGEAKAYLSPNKALAADYYSNFLELVTQNGLANEVNEKRLVEPDMLDKILHQYCGVK